MGIGAAIGGIAGGIGSLVGANASKSAANTQAAAANQAALMQQQEVAQTRADLSPFRTAGNDATASLETILGLPGGNGINPLAANGIKGLTFQPTQEQLAATPGYQFDLAQGQNAVANSNAASGRGISGAALKGAANFATGLANNTLTTQAGIFQNNLNNVLNPLTGLSKLGEDAAATTGTQGIAGTTNAGQALVGGANAGAAGTVGSANALAGGLGSLGQTPLNYQLYSQLLNGGGSGGSGAIDAGTF